MPSDPVGHEPCGLLSDAKSATNFIRKEKENKKKPHPGKIRGAARHRSGNQDRGLFLGIFFARRYGCGRDAGSFCFWFGDGHHGLGVPEIGGDFGDLVWWITQIRAEAVES